LAAAPLSPLDNVLQHLQGVRRSGEGYMARCSHHPDSQASLSVKEGADGKVLLHCHAGCSTVDVVASAGMAMVDLFPPESRERHKARVWKGTIPISAHGRPSLVSFGDPIHADMLAELVRAAHVNGTYDERVREATQVMAMAIGVSGEALAEAVRAALATEAVA